MKKMILALFCAMICFIQAPMTADASVRSGIVPVPLSQATAGSYNIDAVAEKVNALVERINSATPTGTDDEKRRQFFALNREIDMMDREIDILDDRLEFDYMSDILSWGDYIVLERKLDALENLLDRAEKGLERRFGMDD
ncbi:MAG TPA: hypothetical protein DC001_05530 [Clostridiales bacterium]|nr:hypothetical protein [Clostridiales bacterium]HBR09266.1 hypothetical protein [Clostridiales bacterium]